MAEAVVQGKYRLERLLAQGGMGAVWTARNLALDVDIAIKFLITNLDDPTTPLRLQREAQLLARLHHVSLVPVHDVGVSETGVHYMVMDLLTGRDLSEHLSELGRLVPVQAVRMLLPILDALRAAHAQGIIHRDIKPENIYLAEAQGRSVPKLLDFGVALARKEPVNQRLTRAGTVIGSPLYMSPEQARGSSDLDERVDVWAACAVLYECLTGQPPFAGDSYEALLHAIVTRPVPPMKLAEAHRSLETIVHKGLEKSRADRWQSIEALGAALAAWLVAQGVEEDLLNQQVRCLWPAPAPGTFEVAPEWRRRFRTRARYALTVALPIALVGGAAANLHDWRASSAAHTAVTSALPASDLRHKPGADERATHEAPRVTPRGSLESNPSLAEGAAEAVKVEPVSDGDEREPPAAVVPTRKRPAPSLRALSAPEITPSPGKESQHSEYDPVWGF